MTSRPFTEEEMRKQYLAHLRNLVEYWSRLPETRPDTRGRPLKYFLEGLVHSILSDFDGCGMTMPAMDIVMRPHEDDKQYQVGRGENWIEDGTVINGDCHLHELWYSIEERQGEE